MAAGVEVSDPPRAHTLRGRAKRFIAPRELR
jgi:hypothetical protein